jgi:hypothetical protein
MPWHFVKVSTPICVKRIYTKVGWIKTCLPLRAWTENMKSSEKERCAFCRRCLSHSISTRSQSSLGLGKGLGS